MLTAPSLRLHDLGRTCDSIPAHHKWSQWRWPSRAKRTSSIATYASRRSMPIEVQLRARRDRPSRNAEIAATVCAHLEKEHSSGASLAELASLVGVSPSHVSRAFRRAMGLPPHAYLALVRVRHACTLLSRGVPLAVVSHETGFFDQSHFTRTFKRIVGVPPVEYAREIGRQRLERRSA